MWLLYHFYFLLSRGVKKEIFMMKANVRYARYTVYSQKYAEKYSPDISFKALINSYRRDRKNAKISFRNRALHKNAKLPLRIGRLFMQDMVLYNHRKENKRQQSEPMRQT